MTDLSAHTNHLVDYLCCSYGFSHEKLNTIMGRNKLKSFTFKTHESLLSYDELFKLQKTLGEKISLLGPSFYGKRSVDIKRFDMESFIDNNCDRVFNQQFFLTRKYFIKALGLEEFQSFTLKHKMNPLYFINPYNPIPEGFLDALSKELSRRSTPLYSYFNKIDNLVVI